ncbi:IS4/Tn5 family transposase DNA-binding protein [Serratia fonticola]|uniref:IS4/Tn5 family transposase DNA-binding protein n=1 Tax=Serratia fonticola TaxID=47917 RepID=UPI002179643D|nr:transposase DNA-binding-containing protein [Serratia fonticola]CAI1543746.1 Uncharacterised protein [Serratia fonticola]
MVNLEQTSLSWLDEEMNSSVFSDRRYASRFKSLMQKLWQGMGNSLPFACQDRATTKAAYRFLSSTRIDEQMLLRGHADATCLRVKAASPETILLLQDTTTFGYHRNNPDDVGFAGHYAPGLVTEDMHMESVCTKWGFLLAKRFSYIKFRNYITASIYYSSVSIASARIIMCCQLI